MKTKIASGIIVVFSLVAIAWGLLWTKSISGEKELSAYFSAKESIYLFYRPNECTVNDLTWEVNGVMLNTFINEQLSHGAWKSIIAQQTTDGRTTLIFEQNNAFRDADFDTLCAKLNIPIERQLMNVRDTKGIWTILNSGNYIILTDHASRFEENTNLAQTLAQRDANASFACIIDGSLQAYYCFPQFTKSFSAYTMEDLEVKGLGSLDLGVYNVIPKNVGYIEFLDKDLLERLYPDWSLSPLLEYTESGVVFSALNQVDFYVMPIAEQFSAKEILESVVSETDEANNAIKVLMKVIPGQQKSYAVAIENNLILSSSQGILEAIALSYQLQTGFNTTRIFSQMMSQSPGKVHYRWFNRQKLLRAQISLRLPFESSFGYAYFRNRDKKMRYVSLSANNPSTPEPASTQSEVKVLWNYSVKNEQSAFYQNANAVVGIYNPSEQTFSIVDGNGKILNSITIQENLKSVHPLEKGFLLETFDKLIWFPELNHIAQREYPFKGQIQSTIASYTWNGEEFLTFISEQKLHKLSLKNGKIETISIPVQLSNKLPQLHAFNHKNKLHLGYFSDQQFHAVNVTTNQWIKESLQGEIVYSEKIDGKIHFIEQVQGKGTHKVLFGGIQQVFNNIKPNFAGMVKHNQESVWILRDGKDFFVYHPKTIKGTLVSVPKAEISGFEPIFNGDRLSGMLILDDIQNEVHHFKRRGEELELQAFQKFRGSKFIKVMGNRQFVTFVDGQLVGYGL